ncbi:Aste57867_815 [Aphanomyces stellatus]|uniref:Aste57867_815 protein n=1 Tax=Aphanomyces stellatus TaxID=120398 RepID=A0A485K4K6_9STRA|nr:hypothetical protein As57867_000814 [Aphanomyces stellatus]VFT78039.1 Aste57867_815 [Aphanomyces stellatus]
MPTLAERTQQVREYDKAMKRKYRAKDKAERMDLLAQIHEMEKILAPLRSRASAESTRGLAWKDIALGLRGDRVFSVAQNKALKDQVKAYTAMAQAMKTWVMANSIPASLDGCVPTWRHVTLAADPATRQLGKTWIVNQLAHNADRVFHHYGFSSPLGLDTADDSIQDLSVDATSRLFVVRHQSIMPLPMPLVLHVYRQHMCDMAARDLVADLSVMAPMTTTVCEETDTTLLHRVTLHHNPSHRNGRPRELVEDVTFLVGHVDQGHRVVLVGHDIVDDEAQSPKCKNNDQGNTTRSIRRARQFWLDVRRVSPTSTQVRHLMVIHAPITCDDEEAVSLDDEAAVWRIPNSVSADEMMEAKLRQEILKAGPRLGQVAFALSARRIGYYVHNPSTWAPPSL